MDIESNPVESINQLDDIEMEEAGVNTVAQAAFSISMVGSYHRPCRISLTHTFQLFKISFFPSHHRQSTNKRLNIHGRWNSIC